MQMTLVGKKFGRLTVVKEGRRRKGKRYFWCKCKCGNKKLVPMGNLSRRLHTRSCGCWRRERGKARGKANAGAASAAFKDGLSRSRTYLALANARQRCNNQKSTAFAHYGGKGIRVEVPNNQDFVKQMGQPAKKRSLDRLDSLGNYSLDNTHWATAKQQKENQTNNSILFPKKLRYVSKSGTVSRREIGQAKMMKEIGVSMTPAQTGVCACGRACYYDDKFCGTIECDNEKTKARWMPFVEAKSPAPIDDWKP